MDVAVKQSPNDKRSYKRLVLENGIRVLLIHDSEISIESMNDTAQEDDASSADSETEDMDTCKKAAACMTVEVGTFSDPEDIPGLAHYLEHMLFMGSEKFPNENEYDSYLSKHGGSCNAWTDRETTTYFFKVNGSGLIGALDRFAQFFVAPLCLENTMEREVMAVDSEFFLGLHEDETRMEALMNDTAKEGSTFLNFNAGNRKSLKEIPESKGIPVREKLLEFHKQHYSAERMCLAILGGQSLEELESNVAEMFSDIQSEHGPQNPSIKGGKPFEGSMFHMMSSIERMHRIYITFQLPSLMSEYKKKADGYISHLIGHEGPGSLLSELKRRGWAYELSAGVPDSSDYHSNTVVSLFEVVLTLTDEGIRASPGYGLAPVMLLFSYIQMLRDVGPVEWIYNEIKHTADVKVQFLEQKDSDSYVSEISATMHKVVPGDELLCEYMYEDWDPNRVSELLSLMHPHVDGLRIDLQTSNFDSLKEAMQSQNDGMIIFKSIEERLQSWYDYTYMKCELHTEILNAFVNYPRPESLTLPPKNPYLPHDFTIHSEDAADGNHASYVKPDLLTDEEGLRVWHKVDHIHNTPKAFALFSLTGPIDPVSSLPVFHATPKAAAANHLLAYYLEDILSEDVYLASMAGLHCFVYQHQQGIAFRFSGFFEKLPTLVNNVFNTFVNPKIDDQVFSNKKEDITKEYENVDLKTSKYCGYTKSYMLHAQQWHLEEILKELKTITADDLYEHWQLVLKNVHIDALLYGNIQVQDALKLCRSIRGFGTSSLCAKDQKLLQCLKLEPGYHCITMPAKNPKENNSCLQSYIQCGLDEVTSRSILDLIEHICDEPCFDVLRTKEQLGYIVHCQALVTQGVLGFCITIISERYPPAYLEKRVEAFLKTFEQTLDDLTIEELEKHRAAIIESKMEKDKNLKETTLHIWKHITSHQYDFDAKVKEVHAIKHLTKGDILEWFRLHISPAAKDRRKLSVSIIYNVGDKDGMTAQWPKRYTMIDDLRAFRSSASLYPEPSVHLQ